MSRLHRIEIVPTLARDGVTGHRWRVLCDDELLLDGWVAGNHQEAAQEARGAIWKLNEREGARAAAAIGWGLRSLQSRAVRAFALTLINNDDELTLSARERGHTYAARDVILGRFRVGDLPEIDYVVRYESENGYGGFVDETGYVLESGIELVAWRYATGDEIERFEAGPEAYPEEESVQP